MPDEDACLDRTTFDQIRNENSDERSAEGKKVIGDDSSDEKSEGDDDSSMSPGKRTRNHRNHQR